MNNIPSVGIIVNNGEFEVDAVTDLPAESAAIGRDSSCGGTVMLLIDFERYIVLEIVFKISFF